MQIPVEIAFHNVEKADWAEDAIRDHVARLEQIYERLTTCRVRVDQRARNASNTIPPVVHIQMSVPGHKDLVHGYVLSDFSKAEREDWVPKVIDAIATEAPLLVSGAKVDDEKFMSRVAFLINPPPPKPPKADPPPSP